MRRAIVTTLLVCAEILCTSAHALNTDVLAQAVVREEKRLHARIGMAVIDTGSGQTWQHRGQERFPLNSTFKAFACAAVLAQVDRHQLRLDAAVPVNHAALVSYSPVTQKVPQGGTMRLFELCEAAVSISDNTAANLVLDAIGGTTALTAFMRSMGDEVTRLDRREPNLNEATPGDVRDTTTPLAAAQSLRMLLLGNVLSSTGRAQLTQWMLDDQVADALLRAALPDAWRIADKSGAGGHGSRSIIAVIWPPEHAPIVVAIYVTQTPARMSASNQAIARLGAKLVKALR